MTVTQQTEVSAPVLREELGRPWTTIWRWAEKAGIWDGWGSGRPIYFSPSEAAGLRTLDRVTSLLGEVRPDLAKQIVRAPGPVLLVTRHSATSVSFDAVPSLLGQLAIVALVPVVNPEIPRHA